MRFNVDDVVHFLARWLIPNKLAYWVIIVCWARVTTTEFADREPDSVTVFEVLETLQ